MLKRTLIIFIFLYKIIISEQRKMSEVGSFDMLKRQEFERFDLNNDRMLDPQEIRNAFNMEEIDVIQLFHRFDKDGKGFLTMDDYLLTPSFGQK